MGFHRRVYRASMAFAGRWKGLVQGLYDLTARHGALCDVGCSFRVCTVLSALMGFPSASLLSVGFYRGVLLSQG